MKTTIDGATLHEVVAWAAKLCPTRPPVPVTAGILLEADTDLTFSAFDFETAGVASVGAGVADPGRALVSGRLLAAVAKTLRSDDEIELSGDERTLRVRAGSSSWSLPCLNVEDYPRLPSTGDPIGEVDAEAFRAALSRVLPAVSRDQALQVLSCVEITVDPDQTHLVLAATDRYRLAVADLPWTPAGGSEARKLLAPGDLLRAATAVAGSGTVALASDGNTLSAVTDTHRVTGRLLGQEFVKWSSLFPTEHAAAVTVNTAPLLRTIERAETVLAAYGRLAVEFSEGGILASAADEDGDTAGEHTCPVVSYDGPTVGMGVNPRYFADAITAAGTDTVRIELADDPKRPFVVRACDPDGAVLDGYRHLVMTMRGKS